MSMTIYNILCKLTKQVMSSAKPLQGVQKRARLETAPIG